MFAGFKEIQDGFAPVGDWFKSVKEDVSELNKYAAMKAE